MQPQFNCLYRWHATTSQADEQWVTTLMGSIFKDKPIDKVAFFPLNLVALLKVTYSLLAMTSRKPSRKFKRKSRIFLTGLLESE